MPRLYNTDFPDYYPLLDKHSITYQEEGNYLIAGTPCYDNSWLLFLSIRPTQADIVIDRVLPLLASRSTSFKIAKNQIVHIQVNDGVSFSTIEGKKYIADIRKCLTIFPKSQEETQALITDLNRITKDFQAPEIPDAFRIGNLLYIRYHESSLHVTVSDETKSLSKIDGLPFRYDKGFHRINLKRKFFNRRFVSVNLIQSTLKTVVIKAIDLKKFSLSWCALKLGAAYSLEDYEGRDVRHRLRWERDVLTALQGVLPVPKIFDYFENDEFVCLVTEWIEGTPLDKQILGIFKDRQWQDLDDMTRLRILSDYQAILNIIHGMHQRGYIHRDIKPANFIVSQQGEIKCIDFEISYSMLQKSPSPPFLLGTTGYASEQQLALDTPTVADDIFALGSLLLFFVTGIEPHTYFENYGSNYEEETLRRTGSRAITNIIRKCHSSVNTGDYTSVREIYDSIRHYMGQKPGNEPQCTISNTAKIDSLL